MEQYSMTMKRETQKTMKWIQMLIFTQKLPSIYTEWYCTTFRSFQLNCGFTLYITDPENNRKCVRL